MESIETANTILLFGSVLVLLGILSSLIAQRFGAPLLLVFLVIGMLAGEDGPGGIAFSDYRLTYLIGSLALAVILFDGGLRTKLGHLRGAVRPALLLAKDILGCTPVHLAAVQNQARAAQPIAVADTTLQH